MQTRTIIVVVAGVPIGLRIADRAMHGLVARRYAGYVVTGGASVLTLDCSFGRRTYGRSNQAALVRRRDGSWEACRRDFCCAWSGRAGTVRMHPSVYSFDACLRVVLSALLPERQALLVHASAVAGPGGAVVFAGPSGSGKTTAARLSRSSHILNDEICAVLIDKGNRLRVTGTPFWGEMGTGPAHRRLYPLDRLLFLRKAALTRIVPLPPGQALRRLLGCVCLFGRHESQAQTVLELAARVVALANVGEFQFRKEPFDPFRVSVVSG
jgi:hypothetical protein